MKPAIEVCNLSKRYALGERSGGYGSLREDLAGSFRRLCRLGGPDTRRREPASAGHSFWALKDVSFSVDEGETVAIIGSNGAGKSTLLKIASRITDPTDGEIRVRGRMGSLLEVGTGFHPELTGRENIFLNGIILGMRRAEVAAKFDEIVSFAGVEDFLDTPVKRYSSGMYVRLAFSVAAHLDPEILVVDEVLAVGDVAFQKKCLGKMAEACARSKTVLFVSHNLAAVEGLCTRGIVLDHGRVVFDGPSRGAVRFYLESLRASGEVQAEAVVDLGAAPRRSPKQRPLLRRLELLDVEGEPLYGALPAGAGLTATVHFDLPARCQSVDVELAFETLHGQRVCTAHSAYEPDRTHTERVGLQTFRCDIPALPLVPGEYKLHVGLYIASGEADWVEDATRLSLVRSDYYGTGVMPTRGLFLVQNRWRFDGEPPAVDVFSLPVPMALEPEPLP